MQHGGVCAKRLACLRVHSSVHPRPFPCTASHPPWSRADGNRQSPEASEADYLVISDPLHRALEHDDTLTRIPPSSGTTVRSGAVLQDAPLIWVTLNPCSTKTAGNAAAEADGDEQPFFVSIRREDRWRLPGARSAIDEGQYIRVHCTYLHTYLPTYIHTMIRTVVTVQYSAELRAANQPAVVVWPSMAAAAVVLVLDRTRLVGSHHYAVAGIVM